MFKITPEGILTILVSFNGANGADPVAGLVQGSDGDLYGCTDHGGGCGPCTWGGGCGTAFRISTNGVMTTLVCFDSSNGAFPDGTLVQGSDGNFYGTTFAGGAADGWGTVFTMATNGVLTTLFSFNDTDATNPGQLPDAGLVRGNDRNFYGTTITGQGSCPGCTGGPDTVFKMTPNGALTTLFVFDYNGPNGYHPRGALALGSDGNFYGTTESGGAYDGGTVFRLLQAPPPVITAIAWSRGTVTLTWTSFTNGVYRVKFKPSLDTTDWTALAPDVAASGSTASFTNNVVDARERYYRVVLLP